MATTDKTTSETQKEVDAGRASVLAAYNDMVEAQGHFRRAAEAAGLDLKNEAVEQLLKGRAKADAVGDEIQRYVHDKPVATLGIAFFAGLLVSQLLSRK